MAELSPVARALLETIAGPESKGDYNVLYGGGQFDDYSDHPRQYVMIQSGPNKGKYSSAAGKYQFLGSTWDDQAEKLGLTDFSPASQDAAAWNLAVEEYKRDTGRDLEADLAAGDISRVAPSLKNQWTSLPGGIEQGIGGSAFANAYAANLGKPQNPAVGAINAATQPAVMRPGWQQAWANPGMLLSNPGALFGGQPPPAAAPIMRAANAVQQVPQAIMRGNPAMTVAGRTAAIEPMMKRIMTGSAGGTPLTSAVAAQRQPGESAQQAYDQANRAAVERAIANSANPEAARRLNERLGNL
jgi:muramidase (phage lysozyme)